MDTKQLTGEDIDAMEAGRDMDALVAERVMEWSMYHYDKDFAPNCYWMLVDNEGDPAVFEVPYKAMEKRTEAEAWAACPKFSTDIAAAWQVVEHISGEATDLHIENVGGVRYHVTWNNYRWGKEGAGDTWVVVGEGIEPSTCNL